MKLVCISYRDWALSIYDEIAKKVDFPVFIVRSKEQYDEGLIQQMKPDLILFYGWSWIVEPHILSLCDCLMLHPSPLPKYRGGSPIQNQIIAGEKTSAVSIFAMSEGVDDGDIVTQESISLDGDLQDVLNRMTTVGLRLTLDLLENGYTKTPQDHSAATYCKRRKPSDSEITGEEIQSRPAEYLHNKIRMLQDPYPNAYIRTSDNRKLYIQKASIGD